MAYRDPRCVFVSDTLGEGEVVANWLSNQNIRAEVVNPDTIVGLLGGAQFLPGTAGSYGIEVWVFDSVDVPKALELLADKKMLIMTRTATREATGTPIAVECEDCGTETTFPPEMAGTVQDCPNCAA